MIAALSTFTSIAAATLGISYQVHAPKESEVQFKVHGQRKETYEALYAVLEKLLQSTQQGGVDYTKVEAEYPVLHKFI